MKPDLSKARWFRSKGRKGSRRSGLPNSVLSELKKQHPDLDVSTPPSSPKTPRDYAALIPVALLTHESAVPDSLSFTWKGARLMTLNQLMGISHQAKLTPYKRAWHDAVAAAVSVSGLSGFQFDAPVVIRVHRQAKRYVDNDAMQAMFKYIIDGFRYAGVLVEDNPLFVLDVIPTQSLGDYAVTITIERPS